MEFRIHFQNKAEIIEKIQVLFGSVSTIACFLLLLNRNWSIYINTFGSNGLIEKIPMESGRKTLVANRCL